MTRTTRRLLFVATGLLQAMFWMHALVVELDTVQAFQAVHPKQLSLISSARKAIHGEHSDCHQENKQLFDTCIPLWKHTANVLSGLVIGGFVAASLTFAGGPVWAENELSDRYGGGGLDTSLVDQTCLIDHCSLQAKSCLADDASCRKGLTCTAKCLGDNACITGCMARYGTPALDQFLKCTIEDHECIKIAILDGGADTYGQEPAAPGPTLVNFDAASLQGTWYKVVGYNPNYDCYACQRNSFSVPPPAQLPDNGDNTDAAIRTTSTNGVDRLQMEVEFSMPHLLPDGSPPPPQGIKEEVVALWDDPSTSTASGTITASTMDKWERGGPQSIGLNAYHTSETMIFDRSPNADTALTWNRDGMQGNAVTYARTAHSEGEMFGLKFWENWYVLGENDPGSPEFKFIYYNGKTRQNTYEGAFVYSRTKELAPESMLKVYQIAKDAGMNPHQFCKIRNGCFKDDDAALFPLSDTTSPKASRDKLNYPFRGVLASTKVSEIFGVEPVAARDMIPSSSSSSQTKLEVEEEDVITAFASVSVPKRSWWYEVGDYLENPHRHFQTMERLRVPMDWPEDIILGRGTSSSD